jgi:hypothetical protein
MRSLTLSVLAFAAMFATAPARAQTFDPAYPVCLHVYGPVTYNECSYTSLAQCHLSATGRSAECIVNPFAASEPPARARRSRRGY